LWDPPRDPQTRQLLGFGLPFTALSLPAERGGRTLAIPPASVRRTVRSAARLVLVLVLPLLAPLGARYRCWRARCILICWRARAILIWQALSVLKHFDVVGLTERFDESLLAIGYASGMSFLG
jgi:hypothetical protein